jgi:CopG family nickel-responsive transcriptional regulator
MKLERISLTIPSDLLQKLDDLLEEKGYASRSEAIRDAVTAFLAEQRARMEAKGEIAGVLAFLYDHEVRGLADRITDLQHGARCTVVSSLHWHVNKRSCLEVLLVRGRSEDVYSLASEIESMRGVKQLKLIPFMM